MQKIVFILIFYYFLVYKLFYSKDSISIFIYIHLIEEEKKFTFYFNFQNAFN